MSQANHFILEKRIKYIKNYGDCKRVVLFTNARDEKNIKEWAAHHILLGFSAICIFDHKSNPPISPAFRHFDKRVNVIRIEFENPVKLRLMNMAVTIAKQTGFDWMMYLDADEFLILNSFAGVKKMLNAYKYAHSLSINWVMFGTNHHVNEPQGLILDNYTKSELTPCGHCKTFVRPDEVISAVNPHWFNIKNPSRMISITNKIMQKSRYGLGYALNPYTSDYNKLHAYIAHYVYQSEATYLNRKVLLAADDGTGCKKKDPELHNRYNDVENYEPRNKYAAKVREFLNFIDPCPALLPL